jgi:ABC-type sugar transport system ATPase subunit
MDLYNNPDNCFIASFIGSPRINLFNIEEGRAHELAPAPFPGVLLFGTRTIGVRPEHIRHAPSGLPFAGSVEIVERLGHASYLYVRMPGGLLVTILERGTQPISVGDAITFQLPQEHLLMFDADGHRVSLARAA